MAQQEFGVLYHKKFGLYLELVRSDTRFHKNVAHATPVEKAKYDDPTERYWLLDHHNVDWHRQDIEWRPLPNTAAIN